MANIIENILNIYGSEYCIDCFQIHLFNENNEFSFEILLPTPQVLLEISTDKIDEETKKLYLKKYGEYDWYSWRIKNWGTKWEPFNVSFERVTATNIEIYFETAGGWPEPWLKLISMIHFELLFEIDYMCEFADYFGIKVFQDGEMISSLTSSYGEVFEDLDDSFEVNGPNNKE